ncbi:hypothetical protein VC83_04529 [Pseudogymnoascus destructans]|uniref:Retrotransposon Copia-like N-terminal domain-containing protein n=1 Tax=Pseudogymnoascus destructans TaxID=655981 RepID=A0A177A8G0_9PEZI|nr:uncharacterized protein VC83_04529 [Pseudogymnoascus destructans]OAF57324.1 hypothetical protein VC83_04529 [Pseudogymnoascus destructans]
MSSYHTHPATENSASFVPIQKDCMLDGDDNYKDWSKRMINALQIERLWDLVDGYETELEKPDPNQSLTAPAKATKEYDIAYRSWRARNQMACGGIKSTLNYAPTTLVEGITNAKETWDTLADKATGGKHTVLPYCKT